MGSGGSGVSGVGSLPASTRYSRWSEKFEKNTVSPATAYAPPPYSCTVVRADQSLPMASRGSSPGVQATTTWRPPSVGRPSSQYTRSPSTSIWPNATACSTSEAAVIGEGQDPYGSARPVKDLPRTGPPPPPGAALGP